MIDVMKHHLGYNILAEESTPNTSYKVVNPWSFILSVFYIGWIVVFFTGHLPKMGMDLTVDTFQETSSVREVNIGLDLESFPLQISIFIDD